MTGQTGVVLDGVKSCVLPVISGVPQGSMLGPLLFLIYIDKVSQAVLSCKLGIYADDIVMYQMMISLVQTDFYILYDWIKETD